jgi:Bifunctional DNA primase/polymerase, N-terminal
MTSNADNVEAALRYAEDGIALVPLYGSENGRCGCGNQNCRSIARHSCSKNGILDATTDANQIRRFWKKYPKAKIGIVLGKTANVIALEIDGEQGRYALKKLKANNGNLPHTVTVCDYRRRLYLFKADDTQTIHTEVADGVRLLSDGDLVAIPRARGQKHYFLNGRGYEEVGIAKAPAWLIASAVQLMADQSIIDGTVAAGQSSKTRDRTSGDDSHELDNLVAADIEIPFHPLANIFPPLDDAHRRELEDDIRVHGQQAPIVLYESKILDGRALYVACKIVGVAPKFEEYAGSDALGFLLGRNALRRHLDESQRAMVAARVVAWQSPPIYGAASPVSQSRLK